MADRRPALGNDRRRGARRDSGEVATVLIERTESPRSLARSARPRPAWVAVYALRRAQLRVRGEQLETWSCAGAWRAFTSGKSTERGTRRATNAVRGVGLSHPPLPTAANTATSIAAIDHVRRSRRRTYIARLAPLDAASMQSSTLSESLFAAARRCYEDHRAP